MKQVENRVSGIKDKIEKLDHSGKDKVKILRKYEQNLQELWDTLKRPILSIEEGEGMQVKGIENIFNKITAQNFPNLEKQRVIQV
jgi:predicted  nucleic acid-binding Zn-ribbon protein